MDICSIVYFVIVNNKCTILEKQKVDVFKDQDFHMSKKSMNNCNIWKLSQENEGQILV
jgi:hypothetical protein